MIQRLPKTFRTRRGFAALIGIVAFLGFGVWYLIQGEGFPVSLVAGITSGLTAFLFFWFVLSRVGTGFDD
jgi:hypothetical protein